MIYLIAAETNKTLKTFPDMDEALEAAHHYAPRLGDMALADSTTSALLLVTADGKTIDMHSDTGDYACTVSPLFHNPTSCKPITE